MQEVTNRIAELKDRFQKSWQAVGIPEKRQQIITAHEEMNKPGFWNDRANSEKLSREASHLEKAVEEWETFKNNLQNISEIAVMDEKDQTVNMRVEIDSELAKLEEQLQAMEIVLLLGGKYDAENALIAIHAGAGGTDAQDWAEMLLRMYLRFFTKMNWKSEIITISEGGEAGIKSVLLEVIGENAYGYLKAEAGVHRLVRISPFDAEKMRHTSFALVEVLPIISMDTEIIIKPEDLRIDTFRAGGHGGQSVNKTDSAVRITHLPTGMVVSCQNERSQVQNKEKAMKVLQSKLHQYYETELEDERQRLRGEYTEAAWGNQARSYVIHPYKLVKDHRTDFELKDVDKVLDGDLMPFIEQYLRSKTKK